MNIINNKRTMQAFHGHEGFQQLQPQAQQIPLQVNPFELKGPLTNDHVDKVINLLENCTTIFYNQAGRGQDVSAWKQAQATLLQFQQISEPISICMEIIKKTRDSLVLYQVATCLKNSVANEFKKYNIDQMRYVFEMLYEFLCIKAVENEPSVNETLSLTCAMILKRIAIDKNPLHNSRDDNQQEETDKVAQVINTLCTNVRSLDKDLCSRLASALMLSSLLLECQMSNRSTALGIRVWKHLQARRIIETHLKPITESSLETINWAFSSNILNPSTLNTLETRASFSLVSSLIQCVEYCLSFNSADTGTLSGGDRVLRIIQNKTINMISLVGEQSERLSILRAWSGLVMSREVVQFLFTLYKTIKSMISVIPQWARDVLKSLMNCLYYLSDIQNSIIVEKDDKYIEFIGNIMLGVAELMKTEEKGIDDSFQIASLLVSLSLYTSDTKLTLTKLNVDSFLTFIDTAKIYTCRLFALVATTDKIDEEEEEERTLDLLLDFWFHIFRNLNSEAKYASQCDPPRSPKLSAETIQTYSRSIVESYISAHLHKPLGMIEAKKRDDDLDVENASDLEDNVMYSQQLVAFGLISRLDAPHTAKILIELFSARVNQYEAFLSQNILTHPSPDGFPEWEIINDDLHWLLLLLQNFITTNSNELGFMSDEILQTSINYNANPEKTLKALETFDFSSNEVDPIVRLIAISLKLCQIEMHLCRTNKTCWMSSQTNHSLTTMLSRFCLTYLYAKEDEYSIISPNINNCFGQDSQTAKNFLKFIVEHSCCMIIYVKSDHHIVSNNVQLFLQLFKYHNIGKDIPQLANNSDIIRSFLSQIKPENLDGFSPKVAKSIMKLLARLFVEVNDWNRLVDFFTTKWQFIIKSIESGQHQSGLVATKFLEFCDYCMGLCEAADDEIAQNLLKDLLAPIVDSLPNVMNVFSNFDNILNSVFELLYNIARSLTSISPYECDTVHVFYCHCKKIVDTYVQVATRSHKSSDDEEFLDTLHMVVQFLNEVMKRDWGNQIWSCEDVIKHSMQQLSTIMKPEYFEYPKIRQIYYRLLLYLVDEMDRLLSLGGQLFKHIIDCVLLVFQNQFEKEVETHAYTIISIVCRVIYDTKLRGNNTGVVDNLSQTLQPCLPALFESTISKSSFKAGCDSNESVGPAFFALRICYMDTYTKLVQDLIQRQNNPLVKQKLVELFESLESKVSKLTLSRQGCREFNTFFVPFMNELQAFTVSR